MKARSPSQSHRSSRARRRLQGAARTIKPLPSADPVLLQLPDGIYWQADGGEEAFGPFETYELARVDLARGDEERPLPGQTREEVERELGMKTWVDEATGEVPDGQCPPHLPRP